jgi:signal transduction histidine kinase
MTAAVFGKITVLFSTIRARLILLILIALLPAVGVALFNAIEQRQLLVESRQVQLTSLVKAAGEDLLMKIRDNQSILRVLAEVPDVKTARQPICAELLKSLVNADPWYPLFLITNGEGQGLCGSEPGHRQNNYRDRGYFQSALKLLAPVVGRPVTGRVTKKPVLPIAQPIVDSAQQMNALLISALDLSWYGETIARQTPFAGTTITLWDDQGRLIYRYPDNALWAGKNLSGSAIATEVLKSNGVRALEGTGVDGEPTVYAISDLPGYESLGLRLAIGTPKDELFKIPNQQLIRTLVLLLLVFVLAVAAANVFATRLVARPIDRLVAAARHLEAGNLQYKIPEPLPAGELGILAGTLNDSMSALKVERDEVLRLNNDLERRVAERTAQLEIANRELEAFSYSVSHDLRAPLRHIQGFCELLPKSAGDQLPAKAQHYIKTISDSAQRMGDLIDDLLSFSRMQRAEMHETRVDLMSMVNEVAQTMAGHGNGRKIEWKIAALPGVQGDSALLRQVFVNLIGNAVKYTRPRDPAVIEVGWAGEENGHHTLFVRDNGVGFDMQYAHKLFGVFQRLHSNSEFEGTGIGLANVQRIIARHGGRVWAESEPEKGATMFFTLKATEVSERQKGRNDTDDPLAANSYS